MKTASSSPAFIMVYDDACPLCVAYTRFFVKTGLLPSTGRIPYSEAIFSEYKNRIDQSRGVNEIPLIDLNSSATYYGVDALLQVLGARWPVFRLVKKIKPLYWFVLRLYFLVSYNRKVIVPPAFCNSDSCSPRFNLKYRLTYFTLAMAFTASVFYTFADKLSNTQLPVHTYSHGLDVLILFLPAVGLQLLFSYLMHKPLFWSYIGHIATFNIIGAVVLLPGFILFGFVPFTKFVIFGGILTSVIVKGILNVRRCRAIGMPTGYAMVWSLLFLASFLIGWFGWIVSA